MRNRFLRATPAILRLVLPEVNNPRTFELQQKKKILNDDDDDCFSSILGKGELPVSNIEGITNSVRLVFKYVYFTSTLYKKKKVGF